MNDPVLLAKKFGELARLAGTASTEFEKASVYAAVEALAAAFNADKDQVSAYALENVEKVSSPVCS